MSSRVLIRGEERGMVDSDEVDDQSEPVHHGWEVEYLTKASNGGGVARSAHPAARHYELVSDRNETTPTLVLSDEEDKTIAIYNGLSWIAARRLAKPGESV